MTGSQLDPRPSQKMPRSMKLQANGSPQPAYEHGGLLDKLRRNPSSWAPLDTDVPAEVAEDPAHVCGQDVERLAGAVYGLFANPNGLLKKSAPRRAFH